MTTELARAVKARIVKVAWQTPNHDTEEIAEAGAREAILIAKERIAEHINTIQNDHAYMPGFEEVTAKLDALLGDLSLVIDPQPSRQDEPEFFPIMGEKVCTRSIVTLPWALIAPHEAQAKANHDQTIKRLAERGGLAPCEAVAVLEDRPWVPMRPFAFAENRLRTIINERCRVIPATCPSVPTPREAPVRIQRSRAKGWQTPPNTVYVGRPTKFGNPFRIGAPGPDDCMVCADAEEAVVKFRSEILTFGGGFTGLTLEEIRRELRGKNLSCWCRLDRPCHADVLLELANR